MITAKCFTPGMVVQGSLALALVCAALIPQTAHAATPAAKVVLAVSQSGNPVAANQIVTYQITASNTGTAAVNGVTIQASVPPDTTITQAQAGGASCTGNWPCTPGEDLYWEPNIAAGASATVQFSAQLNKKAPSDGTTIATTVTTSIPSVPAVTAKSLVRSSGGVNVAISCDPTEVASPGQLACTLEYSNTGTTAVAGTLTYTFPSSLSVAESTGGSVAKGSVTWGPLSLAAGAGGFETVHLAVPAGLAIGTLLAQTAELQPSTTGIVGATDGTVATINSANALDIGVSASPDAVAPGQTVTYSLNISDPGTNGPDNVVVYASVPNGTSVTQAQAGGGKCLSGNWPCTAGEDLYWQPIMAAGDSVTLQFSALVASGAAAPPAGSLLTTTVTTTGLSGSAVGVVPVK